MPTRTIRMVLADSMTMFPDGILPPIYPPGQDPGDDPPPGPSLGGPSLRQMGLILALISLAGTIMGAVAFLSSDDVPGMDVAHRQLKRLQAKVKTLSPWPEGKKLIRTLALGLFKKEDIAEYMAEKDKPSPRVSYAIVQSVTAAGWGGFGGGGGMEGPVSKTKVKVAVRVFTVAVGLLGVAIKLFSLFSDWEDDPGMVALFQDTKGVVRAARQTGISGALQKAQNMEVYRIIRNIPGIGVLLPRGGRPILGSASEGVVGAAKVPIATAMQWVTDLFDPNIGGGEPAGIGDILDAINDDMVRDMSGSNAKLDVYTLRQALEALEKKKILRSSGVGMGPRTWGWVFHL